MNHPISGLPERTQKPRTTGVTMSIDKGLSVRQAEDLMSSSHGYVDFMKLGWCTSLLTHDVEQKIKVYQENKIDVYLGGTLFEAYVIRNAFDEYCRLLDKWNLGVVEVSDGSIDMNMKDKTGYIKEFKKNFTVLSEVGSKDSSVVIPPYKWVEFIQSELDAGSDFVITEARESGSSGMFQSSGEVRSGLLDEILHAIPSEKLLFETPRKDQQVYFIKLVGPNVNLGNINPTEVISLETIRLGLRGDTFFSFI